MTTWREMDDGFVDQVSSERARASQAYILVYVRRTLPQDHPGAAGHPDGALMSGGVVVPPPPPPLPPDVAPGGAGRVLVGAASAAPVAGPVVSGHHLPPGLRPPVSDAADLDGLAPSHSAAAAAVADRGVVYGPQLPPGYAAPRGAVDGAAHGRAAVSAPSGTENATSGGSGSVDGSVVSRARSDGSVLQQPGARRVLAVPPAPAAPLVRRSPPPPGPPPPPPQVVPSQVSGDAIVRPRKDEVSKPAAAGVDVPISAKEPLPASTRAPPASALPPPPPQATVALSMHAGVAAAPAPPLADPSRAPAPAAFVAVNCERANGGPADATSSAAKVSFTLRASLPSPAAAHFTNLPVFGGPAAVPRGARAPIRVESAPSASRAVAPSAPVVVAVVPAAAHGGRAAPEAAAAHGGRAAPEAAAAAVSAGPADSGARPAVADTAPAVECAVAAAPSAPAPAAGAGAPARAAGAVVYLGGGAAPGAPDAVMAHAGGAGATPSGAGGAPVAPAPPSPAVGSKRPRPLVEYGYDPDESPVLSPVKRARPPSS